MAREAVDLRNHTRLSSPETFQKPRQCGTAIAAAHLAPRGAQRVFLQGAILIGGGHARVAQQVRHGAAAYQKRPIEVVLRR